MMGSHSQAKAWMLGTHRHETNEAEEADSDSAQSEYGSSTSADVEKNDLLKAGGSSGGGNVSDEEELARLAGGMALSDKEERMAQSSDDGPNDAKEEKMAQSEPSLEDDEEGEEEGEEEGNDAPSLKTVARWIREGNVRRVLILSGAGVSCSAGIPDFRTPGTGLYDNLQKYNLPYPEAIFDLVFYRNNTDPFVSLAAEIWPGLKFSPTLAHSFVTLLERKGLLLRNYTQNIDGLEVLAGVSEDRIVECHGHFRTASCVRCGRAYDGERCRLEMVHERRAPKCERCKGVVKPDIVFFGEGLPDRFGRLLRRDLMQADLLIVMGTSLSVAPVSMIPEMVPSYCRRVLLNRELVGDFYPGGGPGDHPDVFRDGDCDESVVRLCRWLGWEDELRELNEEARIINGNRGKGRGNE